MSRSRLTQLIPGGSDAATLVVKVSPLLTEDASIGTVRTLPVNVSPAFLDYYPSDAGSFSVKITPSEIDIQSINDLNIFVAKITPILLESAQFPLIEVPTWPVKVTFSPTELLAHQYADNFSGYVDVFFSGDDCYNTPTPDFEVIDSQKWGVQELGHWGSEEIGKKWNVYEVVGDFDNSCFAATVA